mmetsp:Transcript_19539/g.36613  ORF Transcript_19539/g.36613 Transcript_19539/m.36613 type:complete len:91 (-) Transcript_19539:1120-1392(-)
MHTPACIQWLYWKSCVRSVCPVVPIGELVTNARCNVVGDCSNKIESSSFPKKLRKKRKSNDVRYQVDHECVREGTTIVPRRLVQQLVHDA